METGSPAAMPRMTAVVDGGWLEMVGLGSYAEDDVYGEWWGLFVMC